MQHTTLPDGNTTDTTGGIGYLFGGDPLLFILTECYYGHSRCCSILYICPIDRKLHTADPPRDKEIGRVDDDCCPPGKS
jgi:hypothetical protein